VGCFYTSDPTINVARITQRYLNGGHEVPIRLLTTKDGFTMEGINADFTLKVAHLKPAVSVDTQIQELQQQFVKMQWETE
jgi:hypothetical protein